MRNVVLAVSALVVAIACGGPGATPSPIPAAASFATPRPPDVPLQTPPNVPGIPTEILNMVRTEAARLAGVSVDEVGVVAATAVTWNDGSLGCPQPDEMYTQALVRGYQIIVQAGDEEFDFRVGEDGDFRVCDQAGASGATPAGPTPIQPPDPY